MRPTEAQIEEGEIDGPKGKSVDGVTLTCGDCDETVSVPGYDTDENRIKLQELLCRKCPECRCRRFKILL